MFPHLSRAGRAREQALELPPTLRSGSPFLKAPIPWSSNASLSLFLENRAGEGFCYSFSWHCATAAGYRYGLGPQPSSPTRGRPLSSAARVGGRKCLVFFLYSHCERFYILPDARIHLSMARWMHYSVLITRPAAPPSITSFRRVTGHGQTPQRRRTVHVCTTVKPARSLVHPPGYGTLWSAGVGWACVRRYAVVSSRDMTIPYFACMSRRLTLWLISKRSKQHSSTTPT